MKYFICILVASSCGLMSQDGALPANGDIIEIAGTVFVRYNCIWIDQALGAEFFIESDFATTHKSKTWKNWSAKEATNLAKVLTIGEILVYKGLAKDGTEHVYSVWGSKKARKLALTVTGSQIIEGEEELEPLCETGFFIPVVGLIAGGAAAAAGVVVVAGAQSTSTTSPVVP